jgi:hypothetical protein
MEAPPSVSRGPRATTLNAEEMTQWTEADQSLVEKLETWRERAAEARWGPNHMIGGFGILTDVLIDRVVRLARRGALVDTEDLQREFKWHYHSQYDTELLAELHSVYPPCPKPSTPSSSSKGAASARSTEGTTAGSAASNPSPSTTRTSYQVRPVRCGGCGGPNHNSKCLVTV